MWCYGHLTLTQYQDQICIKYATFRFSYFSRYSDVSFKLDSLFAFVKWRSSQIYHDISTTKDIHSIINILLTQQKLLIVDSFKAVFFYYNSQLELQLQQSLVVYLLHIVHTQIRAFELVICSVKQKSLQVTFEGFYTSHEFQSCWQAIPGSRCYNRECWEPENALSPNFRVVR